MVLYLNNSTRTKTSRASVSLSIWNTKSFTVTFSITRLLSRPKPVHEAFNLEKSKCYSMTHTTAVRRKDKGTLNIFTDTDITNDTHERVLGVFYAEARRNRQT